MAAELKLDQHYHDKKLRLVLRDLSGMPADEYARALIRLANVADESVILEPEFTRAQLPSQGGEAVEVVARATGGLYVGFDIIRKPEQPVAVITHPADQVADGVAVSRELRSVLAMILNALDRDAVEGKQARGEMAADLRALLNGGRK